MPLSLITGPTVEPLTIADLARHLRIDAPEQEPSPASAPTVMVAGAAGLVTPGAHRLAVTFVDADGGETTPGPQSTVVQVDAASNAQIAVSALPIGGSRIASRRIYMTAAGGDALFLASTIANNTSTTATVNVADADLGVEAPSTNTTQDGTLSAAIQDARERVESVTGRQLLQADYRLTLARWPACGAIEMPRPPLLSVTSIQYLDTAGELQTIDSDAYVVTAPSGGACRAGSITLAYGKTWPAVLPQADAIRIDFRAGYGATATAVPGPLVRAIRLAAGTFYEQRENDVLDKTVTALPSISLAAQRLLRPYWWRPEQQEAA
jgi:uncharacterized phiE125 gp8 family phage protein